MGHSLPGLRRLTVPTRRPCVLLLAIVLSAGPAAGQTGPTLGTVAVEQVVVRGSPRPDGPDTGTMVRGTPVIVHHAEGDKWLAIQPPRGSLSWVNHRFIDPGLGNEEKFPRNVVVAGERVRLAVGRVGLDRPLDVRWTTVPEGTILKVIGPKVRSPDDGQETFWYPVEPPEDDFRYVPKDAVRLDAPAGTGFAVKSPPQPAGGGSRLTVEPAAASVPAGKPAGWPSHTLWVQAEAAERAGDLDKAERLYFQLAREMNAPGGDADLANLCYTRVHAIRERRRQGPDRGASWTTAPDRSAPATTTSRNNDQPRRAESPAENANRGQWSGAGILRPAFRINGIQMFALEDARNRVLVYAVPVAGVELDRYTRRTVELYGVVRYPTDLRGVGLMTVTKLDVAGERR